MLQMPYDDGTLRELWSQRRYSTGHAGILMTDATKRKISAKDILTDIQSGMDRTGLKRKYELSDKAFESVCKKLSASGALSESELAALGPGSESSNAPDNEEPVDRRWRCPACDTPQLTEMSECPACGIIVAKYIAARDKADGSVNMSYAIHGAYASSDSNNWMSVLVSVVAIILVGVAVITWSTHRSSRKTGTAKLYQPQTRTARQFAQKTAPAEETSADEQSMSIDPPAPEGENSQSGSLTPAPEDTASLKPEDVPLNPPRVELTPPKPINQPAQYATGVLRRFTSADFNKEVVEASKTYPVIFQFYSDTWPPCKRMASVLTQLAGETKGKAIIGLIMTTDRNLAGAFGVSKIPTIFVVRNAEIRASFVGIVPKAKLEEILRNG
jgi:thioredoxin 1